MVLDDLFEKEPEKEQTGNVELRDVVEAVFSTEKMNVKSVLTSRQVVAIARGLLFAEKYDSDLMKNLCQSLLELKVSVRGRSRKDLVQALSSALSKLNKDDETDSIKERHRLMT